MAYWCFLENQQCRIYLPKYSLFFYNSEIVHVWTFQLLTFSNVGNTTYHMEVWTNIDILTLSLLLRFQLIVCIG